MAVKFIVDTRQVDRMFKELRGMSKDVLRDAYKFYRDLTPKRSGNARNKTKLRGDKIKSGYPYAGRLDEGWSKQAPDGMTDPTLDKIDDLIDKELRRIGR